MDAYSISHPYRLLRRESGFPDAVGSGDALARSLYCGMKAVTSWHSNDTNSLPTGGVFNLEFSPDGSLLVAACEKKSIEIFDSLTRRRVHSVVEAHTDCINCVKFLDGRMFATCSDDTTIALWDVRHLKKKIRTLLGHSNWVKNIEFSVKDKLLVTSGLDGSIYTWDINSYTECNLIYQKVFDASGLMRCRLSPDARQMVMCTTGGLLIIVHDLDFTTLAQDLRGFKPNLYRLMQMSRQHIPIAAAYDYLFEPTQKKNRIEFISDFPEGNDAEVVSALQIHPQSWCALSRNISHDDKSEWTCVHDIQPCEEVSDKSTRDVAVPAPRALPRRSARRVHMRAYWRPRLHAMVTSFGALPPIRTIMTRQSQRERDAQGEAGPSTSREAPPSPPDLATSSRSSPSRLDRQVLSSIQNDVWEASITIKQHRMLQEMYSRGQVGRNFNMQRIVGINTGISPPASPSHSAPTPPRTLRNRHVIHHPDDLEAMHARADGCASCGGTFGPRAVRQNRDRLLYYTQEPNEGKGFIKELCFSADGRLICSPFGTGMRLLAFNDDCSELSHCVNDVPIPAELAEVGQSIGMHQELVVSTKFSPQHHLLVTGCLEGRIVWYEPFSGETLY